MKGFRQSRMLKAVAVVLLFFSLLAVPLSVVGEFYLASEAFDGDVEEMAEGRFEKSERFSRLFSMRIAQLAEYMELKEILETDGVLDYDKVVCHMSGRGPINEETKGYTIGELIKRNSFFVEDITSQNSILLENLFRHYYPREQYYVYTDEAGNGALGSTFGEKFIRDFYSDGYWLLVERLEDALDFVGRDIYKEDNEAAEEAGQIIGKQALEIAAFEEEDAFGAESAQAKTAVLTETYGENVVPEGAQWVFTLDELSYRYTYYVAYYLHYHQLFEDNGEHRFIYSFHAGDQLYTNASQIIDECRRNGNLTKGSLSYTNTSYVVDTDIANVDRTNVANLEEAVLKSYDEFEFYAAVTDWTLTPNTEDDAFTIKEHYYTRAQAWCRVLFVIGLVSIFGVFFWGFYLIAAAGHEKGVEGVRLTWFDKWYTEPALFLAAGASIGAVGVESVFIENVYYNALLSDLAAACAVGAVCYVVVLFSLASLLRRIKAGTLWKNSLLLNGGKCLKKAVKRLAGVCRLLYEERDVTARVIIAYLVILAASIVTGILVMVTLLGENILVLFFLLLFAGIQAGGMYVLLRDRMDFKRIIEGLERMADGDLNYKVDEAGMQPDNKRLAVAANRVGDGLATAVEKSIKDERMKTDLITNVSHDIKTPLTSIINYVDLLKREHIEDEKICSYIEVLDSKSQRLKNLTDDLVEASKLSSGNIVLTMQEINFVELVNQANGEFTEKFAAKNLTIIPTLPSNPVIIEADGRRLWRVLENLYNNVAKYAMEHTRVYVSVVPDNGMVSFIMKNISANALNINADELTERFIRGDVSRSTEGSGLGLSIAKSLTELMDGDFEIYLDGDLFRVTVTFPVH